MSNGAIWEKAAHDLGDLRREMQEGHEGKLLNMLVGLIINSNDAYERAEIKRPRKIQVEVDKTKSRNVGDQKGKARVRVIDWAEGMTYEDFGKNFESYGGAKSGWEDGRKISGLFGREASDIMWSNIAANYTCIKDCNGYACQFRPIAEFRRYRLDNRSTAAITKDYSVKKALTIAEFFLNEDYHLPHFDTLANGLKNHFRLRLINQNPGIEISLHYTQFSNPRNVSAVIKFDPLEKEGLGADLLANDTLYLKYKSYAPIKAEVNLFKKKDRDLRQIGDREGGLLIYADDETVLELSLLGFDESAYTAYNRRFFGYVKLHIADIVRQELRKAAQQFALIEVNRSQLRHRGEFYENLKKILDSWLRPHIEAEQAASSSSSPSEFTVAWNRKLKSVFAEINQVAREKTGETGKTVKADGIPPDIMKFARNKIVTSEGTVYRLELLFNTDVIRPDTPFDLSGDNPSIHIDPVRDVVPPANHDQFRNVARKTIRIWSERANEATTISANVEGFEPATVQVLSVEAQIHAPSTGIEWWPDEFEAVENEVSHPTLWIDLNILKVDDSINLSSPAKFVKIIDAQIPISRVDILKESHEMGLKIGRVRPRFKASGLDSKTHIRAAIDALAADLKIRVIEKKNRPPSGSWMFNGIDWVIGNIPKDVDLYPNTDNQVCFNLSHPLIAGYFGSNTKDAPVKVAKDRGLQLLAAHLVVDYILNDISRKAWKSEQTTTPNLEIGTRDSENQAFQVYTYVMKLKGVYGQRWVEAIAKVLGSA